MHQINCIYIYIYSKVIASTFTWQVWRFTSAQVTKAPAPSTNGSIVSTPHTASTGIRASLLGITTKNKKLGCPSQYRNSHHRFQLHTCTRTHTHTHLWKCVLIGCSLPHANLGTQILTRSSENQRSLEFLKRKWGHKLKPIPRRQMTT